MAYVRTLTQECKAGTIELLTRKAEQTLVPRLRTIPGFISYRVGKVDERTLVAIGVFETREGVEELERLGAEWREKFGTDAILSVKKSTAEIILDARAEPGRTAISARPSHPSI